MPHETKPHSMPHVIISCMDRRLNLHLDLHCGPDDVILRNAGANVKGLDHTIRSLLASGYEHFDILTHTDCAAMRYVREVLAGTAIPVSETFARLAKQFEGEDPQKLDERNCEVQRKALEQIMRDSDARGARASCMSIDLNAIGAAMAPQPHTFLSVLTLLRHESYAGIQEHMSAGGASSYFLQAGGIDELMPDINLAVSVLGIRDVRLVVTRHSDEAGAAQAARSIASSDALRHHNVTLSTVHLPSVTIVSGK